MNHSIHSADRGTHLKIVVITLIATIATAGLAIGTRVDSVATPVQIVKAGKPVAVSSLPLMVTR